MKKQIRLRQENFDDLLRWFSADREESGSKYEEIRNGLVQFFYFKGCAGAEDLADETINRVAAKLSVLDLSKNTKPAHLFYGFASKIFLEYLSDSKNKEIEFNADLHAPLLNEGRAAENERKNHECLNKCLAKLALEDRNLIVEFYGGEKSEKIERRKKLAATMKIRSDTLNIKIYRLRNTLRKCIEKCAAEK